MTKKMLFALSAILCLYQFNSTAQTVPSTDFAAMAQKEMKKNKPKLGLKAGFNYAKVTGTKMQDFDPRSHSGFMVSAFYAPVPRGGKGFRTEVVFSRQGFAFDQSGKMQNVTQDYIYLPQLTTFSIGKWVQLQAGGQIGFLLNAQKKAADESNGSQSNVADYMNKLDYGVACGLEIYPVGGLIIGGRYNVGLGNVYKQYNTAGNTPTPIPSPLPFNPAEMKGKNAVVQIFIGYRF